MNQEFRMMSDQESLSQPLYISFKRLMDEALKGLHKITSRSDSKHIALDRLTVTFLFKESIRMFDDLWIRYSYNARSGLDVDELVVLLQEAEEFVKKMGSPEQDLVIGDFIYIEEGCENCGCTKHSLKKYPIQQGEEVSFMPEPSPFLFGHKCEACEHIKGEKLS